MLGEINQTHKDKHCMFYMKKLKKKDIVKTRRDCRKEGGNRV